MTFEEFMNINNYDPDSYDLLMAHHIWKTRQDEINKLVLEINKIRTINDARETIEEAAHKLNVMIESLKRDFQ